MTFQAPACARKGGLAMTIRTGYSMPGALCLLVTGALAAPAAHAGKVGMDVHVGTLGLGLGLDAQLSRYTGLRVGFNRFRISGDWEEDDLDYKARIDFDTFHGLLDWHPFGARFRFTGGIMSTDHRVLAKADVEPGDEIGDGQASQDGRLRAEVEFDDLAPYVGAGWDWRFERSNLEMTLDLGLLVRGDPEASVREIEDTGASDEDLREAEREIESEWSDYDNYAVVQFGLLYRF
jgi:hypothetical protein